MHRRGRGYRGGGSWRRDNEHRSAGGRPAADSSDHRASESSNSSRHSGGGGGGGGFYRGGGRGGRPPGLRGKDIGLYYARLNKDKKEKQEKEQRTLSVRLDTERQQQIWGLLRRTDSTFTTNKSKDHEKSNQDELVDSWENLQEAPMPSSSKYDHIADSAFKRRFLHNLARNEQATLSPNEVIHMKLERDPELDKRLQQLEFGKENNRDYINMQLARARLPASSKRLEILQLLRDNQVVVISGETGCGKTTQVPQFILDDAIERGEGSLCRIVCTQPRRISAISVAQRVAEERCERLGQSVGFQIRLEGERPRDRGSILYCTTGILVQWLQSDPYLTSTSHLVVDEIHERDTLSDFVLTIMKDLLPRRPDMKLILMSATLNAKSFSHYYNNCPMLDIPGLTFPVTTYYLEDVLQLTGFQFGEQKARPGVVWKKHTSRGREQNKEIQEYAELMDPFIRHLKRDSKWDSHVLQSLANPESEKINLELISSLLQKLCSSQPEGAVLIFLPGWDQISKLHTLLSDTPFFARDRYRILPLHSSMPTVNQREIFARPPRGVRKVIIATNIAETSITIDDVVYVIDCGRIKMTKYDAERNLQTLQPEWVSLANAKQRRGRAGRVQPGVCYHLFSRRREMTLDSYPLPEMLRSRLEEVLLQLKILQLGLVRPFLQKVLDPPDPRAIDQSIKLLVTLNAFDESENLTPLGFHLAQLPMAPQIGKMMLMGALFRCLDPVLSMAGTLSHKDPFILPLGAEHQADAKKKELSLGLKSDHLTSAEAMRRWEQAERSGQGRDFCWQYFLSGSTFVMLRNMKRQLAEHLKQMNFITSSDPKCSEFNVNSTNRSLIKAIACAGLYPNVAIINKIKRSRKTGRTVVMLGTADDSRVELHPKSVNYKQNEFESPLLLYHLKLRSTAIFLHDTTMVHPLPLLFFGSNLRSVTEGDGEPLLAMDNLKFSCNRDTATLLKELRRRLDQLLEYKISHPQVVDWSNESPERVLLQAIVELITTEDKSHMLVPDQCEEDDDFFSD